MQGSVQVPLLDHRPAEMVSGLERPSADHSSETALCRNQKAAIAPIP